jgi:serine/threonine protein kinase
MAFMHEQRCIHRDLKPASVLFGDECEPPSCDFGLSKLVERGATLSQSTRGGTPQFMAPEIYVDDGVDFKVDGDGILMFVVLTRLEPSPICRNQAVLGRRVLKGDRLTSSVGARYVRLARGFRRTGYPIALRDTAKLARGFRRTLRDSVSNAPTPAAVSSKESAPRRISRRQGDTFKKALKRKMLTLARVSVICSVTASVCQSIAQWRLRTGDLEQRRMYHGRVLTWRVKRILLRS